MTHWPYLFRIWIKGSIRILKLCISSIRLKLQSVFFLAPVKSIHHHSISGSILKWSHATLSPLVAKYLSVQSVSWYSLLQTCKHSWTCSISDLVVAYFTKGPIDVYLYISLLPRFRRFVGLYFGIGVTRIEVWSKLGKCATVSSSFALSNLSNQTLPEIMWHHIEKGHRRKIVVSKTTKKALFPVIWFIMPRVASKPNPSHQRTCPNMMRKFLHPVFDQWVVACFQKSI